MQQTAHSTHIARELHCHVDVTAAGSCSIQSYPGGFYVRFVRFTASRHFIFEEHSQLAHTLTLWTPCEGRLQPTV